MYTKWLLHNLRKSSTWAIKGIVIRTSSFPSILNLTLVIALVSLGAMYSVVCKGYYNWGGKRKQKRAGILLRNGQICTLSLLSWGEGSDLPLEQCSVWSLWQSGDSASCSGGISDTEHQGCWRTWQNPTGLSHHVHEFPSYSKVPVCAAAYHRPGSLWAHGGLGGAGPPDSQPHKILYISLLDGQLWLQLCLLLCLQPEWKRLVW